MNNPHPLQELNKSIWQETSIIARWQLLHVSTNIFSRCETAHKQKVGTLRLLLTKVCHTVWGKWAVNNGLLLIHHAGSLPYHHIIPRLMINQTSFYTTPIKFLKYIILKARIFYLCFLQSPHDHLQSHHLAQDPFLQEDLCKITVFQTCYIHLLSQHTTLYVSVSKQCQSNTSNSAAEFTHFNNSTSASVHALHGHHILHKKNGVNIIFSAKM